MFSYKVKRGRLFVREVELGKTIVFGLIEMPACVPAERMVAVSMADGMRLNLAELFNPVHHPMGSDGREICALAEHDVGGLFRALQFRKHPHPDTLDCFLRRSHLLHADEFLRWDIVAGAAPGRLACAPEDGLYEVSQGRLKFTEVTQALFPGTTPNTLFREPLWGPDGRYGLATTMEPDAAESVILDLRKREMAKSPEYRQYMERMGPGLGMVYTAQEMLDYQARAESLVREMIVNERAAELENLHARVCERP